MNIPWNLSVYEKEVLLEHNLSSIYRLSMASLKVHEVSSCPRLYGLQSRKDFLSDPSQEKFAGPCASILHATLLL